MIRPRLLAGAAALGLTVGLLAFAGPASAHVTVNSPGATKGGYAVLAFRVPTEKEVPTVKLEVHMPTGAALQDVSAQGQPGWTVTEATSTLATPIKADDGDEITTAVSAVTWTAQAGQGIPVGQFQQFFLEVGPLPDVDSLTFPAIQTYADGSTVSWIETEPKGSTAELEHPAPTLVLADAAATAAHPAAAATDSGSSDTGAVVLAIVALVVALASLAFGFVSRATASGATAPGSSAASGSSTASGA